MVKVTRSLTGANWKGFISWVYMQNMKSLSLMVQKLKPRLKFLDIKVKSQGQGN